jgi:predicted RNA binding protein YcfA (HicA-like mRNA interferase family)
MASLKARDVESALERKGFRKHDGHHSFFVYYTSDNKRTGVRTKMSHGEKDIGNRLIGAMAKQCRLSKDDFRNLVECTLTREQYEAVLIETGEVKLAPPSP